MTEMVWVGAEALRPFLVPLTELTDTEGNPRRGDVMALVGSLRRFGQVRAIATDDGRIVAGHHLRYAAQEMGWTHIAAVPNKFESEQERQAYLLADNQLATLGGYDEQAQLSMLSELEATGRFEGTGFSIDDVEDMRAKVHAVPEMSPGGEISRPYSQSEQEAAERAADLASQRVMREVVLLIEASVYEQFGEWIKVLQRRYGTTGSVATILRAVEEASCLEGAVSAEIPA